MKKIGSFFAFCLLISTSLTVTAQTTQQQQGVQPADDDSVVRITTNLVQVDAVVTDSKGRFITNLGPEDFEILVNGRPQKITNFSLVTTDSRAAQPLASDTSRDRSSSTAPLPPAKIRPEQVKRTIALVVDDLNLSFESINQARKALRKFVDEQMQPGDMVAIVRVGGSVGALQQFTSDKRLLYAAIENVKYNMASGRFRSFEPEARREVLDTPTKLPSDEKDKGIQKSGDPEQFREDRLAVASLRTMSYVVRGMRELPGRKAVMLLSDGFSLFDADDSQKSVQIRQAIERLVDQSGRAGVVVYAMDTRGLVAEGLTPADAMYMARYGTGGGSKEIMDLSRGYREEFFRPLDGLMYLTEQTGGFTVYNSNDLSGGIKKALDDQKSYYLIGFQPETATFDKSQSRFNHLKVKVKATDAKVRFRSGFFGIKDEDVAPVAKTPEQQIMRALTSPFTSDDIRLQLTALFGNDAQAGSYVRSLVHISPEGLTFTQKPDGMREAVINVVAYTFSESGAVVSSVGETHTITLSDKLYNRALQSGLVYSLNVPIKKAGAYQLRVAVRDDKSAKVGSATQLINAPDVGKARLALSGVALSSYEPVAAKTSAGALSAASEEPSSLLTQAAMRRFRAGQVMQFAYVIFNAKVDKAGRAPQLVTQIKLFRDGREIFAGRETPYDAKGQADFERLVAEGSLQLGGLEPGDYVLQVTVTDLRAQVKNRVATNWIDFEVVK
ncbi:MAG TPA: VWA domain-containing protein [Pyrinomonadaceae bacterium]|nr:VWA domain-containing protein [Pyrinomonadaceae bacterium]